jgi:hypothetical protein
MKPYMNELISSRKSEGDERSVVSIGDSSVLRRRFPCFDSH